MNENVTNQVAVFRHELDNMGGQFAAALPPHIPAARFGRVVMTSIQNNPELLECDRRSLWNAAMRAAQDGLLPDNREGAMVVRRDSKSPTGKAASWQPMIAGIRKKARNSGEIATWDAHIVCEGDHFTFQLGDEPKIVHTYDFKTERGAIVGAYSVCRLKDGSMSYEVMSISEIHKIRDRSSDGWRAFKAGRIKSTPWSTDEGEMCRKTVARRHAKVIPTSSDLDDLLRRDDDLYDMEGTREEAQADRPRSLAGRLDALAQLPHRADPSAVNTVPADEPTDHDPETGEIIDQADQAPAAESQTAPAAAGNATSEAKPSSVPARSEAAEPDLDIPQELRRTPRPAPAADEPKSAAEYVAHARAWISNLVDPDSPRWLAEKTMRNRLGVTSEVRDELFAAFKDKINQLKSV